MARVPRTARAEEPRGGSPPAAGTGGSRPVHHGGCDAGRHATSFRSGIGLAAGEGLSVALLVAIFVSNLPEAIGSASDMRTAGRDDRTIVRLWLAVAVVCALATVVGYAVADAVSDNVKAAIDGFAAGALLVMLVDSMIPEAARESGRAAGLVTTLGFAVATGLSSVS